MEFWFVRFGVLPSTFYAMPAGERLVLHVLVRRMLERQQDQ